MFIIQEIYLINTHATAVPFYIRKVWQAWVLNYGHEIWFAMA